MNKCYAFSLSLSGTASALGTLAAILRTMYTEITNLNSWKKLENFIDSLDSKWMFRGQEDYLWPLNSSIDRVHIPSPASLKKNKKDLEHFMLRELERKIHMFDTDLNKLPNSNFQRIAFLQHYGAPTRLVDFSLSPYVALFFAIENSRTDSSLFAFHSWDILNDIAQITRNGTVDFDLSEPDEFDKIMLPANQNKYVGMVQPFFMFDRINTQSGCFLCQGDINSSFEENLVINSDLRKDIRKPFYKIQISIDVRNDCMEKLRRMNISRATLFPDIEGFIRSISNKVLIDMIGHYSSGTAANTAQKSNAGDI